MRWFPLLCCLAVGQLLVAAEPRSQSPLRYRIGKDQLAAAFDSIR